ncbi:MAG: hypothetical protein V1696_00290 [Candidatus Jorgensenbacteria bacterium]
MEPHHPKHVRLATYITAFALVAGIIAMGAPSETRALQIFTPFGGKVKSYVPAPAACISEITLPILVATFFTTLVTIEQIDVGDPTSATLGLLRVELVPIPNINAVKRNFAYFVPGTNVLGNSIDLCGICKKVEEVGEKVGTGFAKNLCKSIPISEELLDEICQLASASGCPVDNLIYQIGSGSPIGVPIEGVIFKGASMVCNAVIGSIPLVGDLLKKLCP